MSPSSASPLPTQVGKIAAPDFTGDLSITSQELRNLLALAERMKRNPAEYRHSLEGKYISMLFEKPSLRTRLSFELAIQQLGGGFVFSGGRIGDREPVQDFARNLDRYTQGIVARVFSQQTIEDLALWSKVPVINALSDLYHPCQALADMQTITERFGGCDQIRLTYVGDGNNVAHSLMLTGARLGMHVTVACPKGYEPNAEVLAHSRQLAQEAAGSVSISHDPHAACRGAQAIYTDVWASMGQEEEAEERKRIFAGYTVDAELLRAAEPGALFMHCLPAKRGLEVTDEVIESPQSVVFDQAENRLHAQKALLLMLLQ